jgi:tetratricopeptide (TPR) repeat protein
MNSESTAEDALYDAARRLADRAARAAFLDAACAGNPTLRERLEKLLSSAPEADDFFNRNAVDLNRLPPLSVEMPTVIAPPPELPGEQIGRYRLLQEIGEGGFGTVWMAEQVEPVSRRVALKIIKLGMDTREVIARFEAERQALAIMDHPNIAKVFDAGATDKGRPFFVMELVKGMPITQYCDQSGLGTRERLTLFGDVCAAINHAHQKGVIHRDIKPSNVLITRYADKPVVKVIDFGIAKATQGKLTEKTLFTRFEQFLGTPVYMSPEQAALSAVDIDTRSDIYALGVLLYELLVGKPPFDAKTLASAGYEEMRRIIREVDPPKPSSRLSTIAGDERSTLARARHIEPDKLHRLVEPDLDWIVMKAIEKDRTRRYETANGLVLDIERFLADEPVSATPPGAGYRFRKFVRRNRTAVSAAAAMVVLFVAGLVSSLWQARRASLAETDALKKAASEAVQRRTADSKAAQMEAVFKFFTEKILSATNPGGVQGGIGHEATVRTAIDAAEKTVASSFADHPGIEAAIRDTLGTTWLNLGETEPAITQYQRALELNKSTRGPEDPETLGSMCNLAIAWYHAGKFDESLALHEETLRLRKKQLGEDSADTLASLNCVAAGLLKKGKADQALPLAEEAFAGRRRLFGMASEPAILSMNNLATILVAAGQAERGLAMQTDAVRLAGDTFGTGAAYTLIYTDELVAMYVNTGSPEKAVGLTKNLIPRMESAFGPDHRDTLACMNNVAVCLSRAGKPEEAIPIAREALRRQEAAHAPGDPDVLFYVLSLAEVCQRAGRLEEAAELTKRVLESKQKQLSADDPEILSLYQSLGICYEGAGLMEDAHETYAMRLAILRKGTPSVGLAGTLADLGSAAMALKKFDEAEKYVRESLELREKLIPGDWRVFSARSLLGECLLGKKDFAAATELLLSGWKGLEAQQTGMGAKKLKILKPALDRLVRLYTALEQPAEAGKWRDKIAEIEKSTRTP